jgi:hypothetical protein
MVEVYRGCKYLLLNKVPMWALDLYRADGVSIQIARASESKFTHINGMNISLQQLKERYDDGTTNSEDVRV